MLKPTQDKTLRGAIQKIIDDNTDITTECSGDAIEIHSTFDADNAISHILDELEKRGYHIGLPSHIEEALNSGDGTYRP